ncbi:MAG: outer membrane protein transport protein [Candidatus Omnitrophota bacterium]|nr:outer membrane protein transport protein [Candidatus Omnitrophota bacterium]
MKKIIVIFSLGLTLFFSLNNAYAAGSGAYRLEVPDAEVLGKGSAFVAQADNPSAIYYNPAGLTQLKGKTYISIGASVVQPFSTYKDTAGKQTDRRRQIFTIPTGFVVSDFGLEKFSFGLGATSYWGLGTYWAEDSFSKYVATKSDVLTQDVMFTAAYALNDNLSVGVGLDYTKSLANKKKKLYQPGGADGDFQLKGRDNNAWGYRISTLYKLNQNHSFGVMYRSAVDLTYKGKVYLNDLNGAGLKYQGTFGGTAYETDMSTKSRLPQSILLGYCFKPSDKWRFEADMEWMDWSSVGKEQIDYPSETNAARLGVLNAGNPIQRDWRGVLSYAFGTEYKVNDSWKLRLGYFFHKTPIPQGTFDTALPDSTSNSLTLGTGYQINKNLGLDFAYAAIFYNPRKINNAVGSSSGVNINGKYSSFINVYMITMTLKL